jgi:hypothetical protein
MCLKNKLKGNRSFIDNAWVTSNRLPLIKYKYTYSLLKVSGLLININEGAKAKK